MTSQEILNFLTPAFRDTFKSDTPDLARFLRLVIDVFEPSRYGPAVCSGDSFGQVKGCGETVVFEECYIVPNSSHLGFRCPKCGCTYPFACYKPPKTASKRVVLTEVGSHIGDCRAESDSGNVVTDS